MYFNVDPIYLDNVEYLILRLCNCVWTYIGYLNMHVFFQASSELSDGVCALPIFIRYPEGLCGSHLTKYSNIYPFCLQKPCLIGCSKYFQIPFAGGCPEMGWIIPSFDQFPHAVCGSKAAKYPMNPYELVAILVWPIIMWTTSYTQNGFSTELHPRIVWFCLSSGPDFCNSICHLRKHVPGPIFQSLGA